MIRLSIVVPCYNSQDYLSRCVQSLLQGFNDVEIIIVDDGSTDGTAAVAERIITEHPDTVTLIRQKNGGHGAAIMTGLAHANGLYFKVVDSDDWFDADAYHRLMTALRGLSPDGDQVDLVICNYIYDKADEKKRNSVRFHNAIEAGKPIAWQDVGRMNMRQYLLMHALIYRTALLREMALELPQHTFYVDNLYAYLPMQYVRRIFYLDVDLYHYYIGRTDQSVNETVMLRQIDQQLKVNRLMLHELNPLTIEDKRLRRQLLNYLKIVTVVSSILLLRSNTKECIEKKQRLWSEIALLDHALYHKLRFSVLGMAVNLPGRTGRAMSRSFYSVARRLYHFS